jgi:hypothetical protein
MRYARGSIKLNRDRDIALLQRIFRSEFVTHSQLFELTQLETPERSRDGFNWRLRRLASHGLVRKQVAACANGVPMYSVSSSGFDMLSEHGEISSIRGDQFARWQELQESRSSHALGLNEIHLALRRSNALVRWIPGTEIQAENDLTRMGYGKDYDAVILLRKDGNILSFALEYERTRKTERRYKEILLAFQADRRVEQLVYIVTHEHLRTFLRNCFVHTKRRIIVVLEPEFQRQLLLCPAEQMGPPFLRGKLIELLQTDR